MKSFLLVMPFAMLGLFGRSQIVSGNTTTTKCYFETDGSGKSKGLKVRVSYLCDWNKAEGERPHVIQKFYKNLGNGESVAQTFLIQRISPNQSKAQIQKLYSFESLKKQASSTGSLVSAKKVIIDGIESVEILSKTQRVTPVSEISMYLLQYTLLYKQYVVNITFATGCNNALRAEELFASYKILFQQLATNTSIQSQWIN